jgi:hypothetical protein
MEEEEEKIDVEFFPKCSNLSLPNVKSCLLNVEIDMLYVGVLYRRTVNLYQSCVGLGWLAHETTRFILVRASEE